MNRKGDISVVIFGVVIIGLYVMTLYTFSSFKNDLVREGTSWVEPSYEAEFGQRYIEETAGIILRATVNCDKQAYGEICDRSIKERLKAISARKDIKYPLTEMFFMKINNGEFILEESNGKVIFQMGGLVIKSARGNNSVARNFGIALVK